MELMGTAGCVWRRPDAHPDQARQRPGSGVIETVVRQVDGADVWVLIQRLAQCIDLRTR